MNNFKPYNKGSIKIEIQSLMPERFINLLWNKGVSIKNIQKINITTIRLEINLEDYNKVEEASKRTDAKVKILERKGLFFIMLRLKKKLTLAGGLIVFLGIIWYLSTFVWSIDIETDRYLSPYEIRAKLMTMGVKPGMKKKSINVHYLEETINKEDENVMWARARIEGARLRITIKERHIPPKIVIDDSINNVVAKNDGEIIRIYTISGTPTVKPGDIVKKGQVVIKGEQGKEGSTYPTHAEGDVYAKTFYEDTAEVKIRGTNKKKTGNKDEDLYIQLLGKRLYLKKSSNKFSSYEKVEDSRNFMKKVIYYEIKEEYFQKSEEKVIEETVKVMEENLEKALDKSSKIINKIVNKEINEDMMNIKVVFIVEENISVKQSLE